MNDTGNNKLSERGGTRRSGGHFAVANNGARDDYDSREDDDARDYFEADDDDLDDIDDDDNTRANLLLPAPIWLAIAGVTLAIGIAAKVFSTNESADKASLAATMISLIASLVLMSPEVSRGVKKRQANISHLLYLAAVGACMLGDFIEAAAVVFLFCVGEMLEQQAVRSNRASIEGLLELTPETVRVVADDGSVSELALSVVALGSRFVVRPGDRVALDAVIVEGSALFDESPITGESMPVYKTVGDAIFAGSLCTDSRIVCLTTATAADSSISRIVRHVDEAKRRRSEYERFMTKFSRFYTPGVILFSLMIALVPPLLTAFTDFAMGGFGEWLHRGLSILVVGCPCALAIAAPIAIVRGITRAASSGVLVKGGAYIELAAKTRVLALDKTGTLTVGKPTLDEVHVMPAAAKLWRREAEDQVLALASLLEQNSSHPLGKALTDAYPHDGTADVVVSDLTEIAGRGINANVAGTMAAIGSKAYIASLVLVDRETEELVARYEANGATTMLLAFGTQVLAVFSMRDTLRPESSRLFDELSVVTRQSLTTVILTGDNQLVTQQIAEEVGVSEWYAGLLPEHKQRQIDRLRREHGTVAFVGDGINDAPALAAADIGFAMGAAASEIALEVADVALMSDSLAELPRFFALSRRVMQTVKTSVVVTLLVKAVVLILAALGIASMWMAIAADVGLLLLVILYAMRI